MKRIQPVACLLQLPKVTGAYRAKAFEFIPSPLRRNFEIGLILHLFRLRAIALALRVKSEIRNFQLD
jgi:hypothetical protein